MRMHEGYSYMDVTTRARGIGMERVKPANALDIPVLNSEPETHANWDQTHQSVSRVLISV